MWKIVTLDVKYHWKLSSSSTCPLLLPPIILFKPNDIQEQYYLAEIGKLKPDQNPQTKCAWQDILEGPDRLLKYHWCPKERDLVKFVHSPCRIDFGRSLVTNFTKQPFPKLNLMVMMTFHDIWYESRQEEAQWSIRVNNSHQSVLPDGQ